MSFFSKLKNRLFRSSSKLTDGLDAIVNDGGEEEEENNNENAIQPLNHNLEDFALQPESEREPEPAPEHEPEPVPAPEPTLVPTGL